MVRYIKPIRLQKLYGYIKHIQNQIIEVFMGLILCLMNQFYI